MIIEQSKCRRRAFDRYRSRRRWKRSVPATSTDSYASLAQMTSFGASNVEKGRAMRWNILMSFRIHRLKIPEHVSTLVQPDHSYSQISASCFRSKLPWISGFIIISTHHSVIQSMVETFISIGQDGRTILENNSMARVIFKFLQRECLSWSPGSVAFGRTSFCCNFLATSRSWALSKTAPPGVLSASDKRSLERRFRWLLPGFNVPGGEFFERRRPACWADDAWATLPCDKRSKIDCDDVGVVGPARLWIVGDEGTVGDESNWLSLSV